MSGWTTKKLGEVCEGSIRRLKDIDDERFLYIDISSIDRERKAIVGATEYERIKAPGRAQQVVDVGDVLVSTVRPNLNAVAIVEGKSNIRRIASTGFCVLRASECILPRYIYYFTQVGEFIAPLVAVSEKAAYPSVTDKVVRGVSIPIPPLAEQKRIVAKIDAAFEKIDRLKANAEKNLANAKELFQSALDEAMRPKRGWGEKRLGEVCSITSNMVDPTLPQFENMLHVGGGNIICETGDLVDLKTAKEEKLKSGKYLFDMGMVLYNKIRPYLKKVARPFFGGLCSADMYPLLPNSSITRDYLYYLLLTTQFTTYAIGESERAGMPKVNREELFAYCMEIPASLAEQKQIAKRLDLLSQKTKALQQNYAQLIADCAEMRQAILREAFEGRL